MQDKSEITWQACHVPRALTSDAIAVWCIPVDDEEAKLDMSVLSAEEQQRALRLHSAHHRIRFIRAHLGLRHILAGYIGQLPHTVVFAKNAQGKPFLKEYPELQFNFSHSGGFAVCAVTLQSAVGIDIEGLSPRKKILPIAQRFFSSAEYAHLKQVSSQALSLESSKTTPSASSRLSAESRLAMGDLGRKSFLTEQQKQFFRLWTCKEAYAKALGGSIFQLFPHFTVQLAAEIFPYGISSISEQENMWQLIEFKPALNYYAAMAIPVTVKKENIQFCNYSS